MNASSCIVSYINAKGENDDDVLDVITSKLNFN